MNKRNRKHLLLVAFLAVYALALTPTLFEEGVRLDERGMQNMPDRYFNVMALKQGAPALYNPYHFYGNPHIALHHTSFFYPPDVILYLLLPAPSALKISSCLHLFLVGWFTALYIRRLRISYWGAGAGSVAMMICAYMISHDGNTANFNSICWIPLLLMFIEGYFQKRDRWNYAGGVVSFALMIFSGYMQTAVITGFLVIVYCLGYAIMGRGRRRIKACLLVGAMLIWGGLFSAIQSLTTKGILPYTLRQELTYELFTQYSTKISYFPKLLFPTFFGVKFPTGLLQPYQGAIYTFALEGWMGVAPVVLAATGLAMRRRGRLRRIVVVWFVVALVSSLLTLGGQLPTYRLMYYVPLYNLFSGSARNWIIYHIAIAILCGIGVHSLIALSMRKPKAFRRGALAAGFATIGVATAMIFFIFTLHVAGVKTWPQTTIENLSDYIQWRSPSIWLPIVVVALNGLALILWAVLRWRLFLFVPASTLLALALFIKFHHYISPYPIEPYCASPNHAPTAKLLREREGGTLMNCRVYPVFKNIGRGSLSSFYPLMNTFSHVRSLSGYGPLFSKGLYSMFGMTSTGMAYDAIEVLKCNRTFSMLNVKYITLIRIANEHDEIIDFLDNRHDEVYAWGDAPTTAPAYVKIYDQSPLPGTFPVVIFENTQALPRVHSVMRILPTRSYPTEDETLARSIWDIMSPEFEFDPRREAVFTGPLPRELDQTFGPAEISNVRNIGPNRIAATIKADETAFVVFAENWWPGWRATVNDRSIPTYRINGVQIGVRVPPGGGEVEIRYLPNHFVYGATISAAMLILLIGLLAMPRRWVRFCLA